MNYTNPIISGFHPDPSVCRVGDDYFLVTSSFEYFPGIPVFHSKDLVNWEQIGHCITRNSQLTLRKGFPNRTGIYAPTIRYQNGIYYVITTNVTYGDPDDGNFIVWTKDPYGEWSNPVWLEFPGIDPSLFFDEDGKAYYMGCAEAKIFLSQLDITTGKAIGERKFIWAGSGGNDPEGPHIYKKDGWYYLFVSEGGTEYGHMITVARSRELFGEYESCPRNPVLTNRSTSREIKCVGHSDLVQDSIGNWWAVCLGTRSVGYPFKYNLGRETNLLPVEWDSQNWPVMGNNGNLEEQVTVDRIPLSKDARVKEKPRRDTFEKQGLDWNTIYNAKEDLYQWNHGLVLHGNEISIMEPEAMAWVGRRQEHHICSASAMLSFDPLEEGEEAGLTIYMNNAHHYEIALTKIHGQKEIVVRRCIGSLWKVEKEISYHKTSVVFALEATKETYTLLYSEDGEKFVKAGQGETAYLTTEVGGMFTGNYIGLYATGNGKKSTSDATFAWLEYTEGNRYLEK